MMNDHQFVMQDGFGEFTASSRALAAGAAAGGDLINQENLDTSNVIDGDANSKSQPAKRTPRPPNAFILYRRAKQPGIIASQRSLTNAEVSRTISDMWRKEPEEIRLEWERYADRKKLEHMQGTKAPEMFDGLIVLHLDWSWRAGGKNVASTPGVGNSVQRFLVFGFYVHVNEI